MMKILLSTALEAVKVPGKQGGGSSITYDARFPTYKSSGRDEIEAAGFVVNDVALEKINAPQNEGE